VKHGDGGKWYFNAKNYSRRLVSIKREEIRKQAKAEGGMADFNPQAMADEIIREAIEARDINPQEYPELKKRAEEMSQSMHFGQVVTLEEIQRIMDIAYPIARISCVCRRNMRGLPDKENFFCMGIGVGMYRWDRWPETYRGGVQFMSPQEAKEWLAHVNKMGMVHTFWTFGTPYIGGVCNCEYPACIGIRNRLDYDLRILIKGEWVARIDLDKCSGCGACYERCQFGALKREVSLDKANIDMMKCFGCGLCATSCKAKAITMKERGTFPSLRASW